VQGIRYDIEGPVVYGPTGPSSVIAFAVPTGGTHLNLDEPRFAMLADAAKQGKSFILAADNANVSYAWALVGSGLSADPSMTVIGPTALNTPGVIYANTRTVLPERAPQVAKGLVVNAYGGSGATGILRIWKIG
jgi:hypothetical protein